MYETNCTKMVLCICEIPVPNALTHIRMIILYGSKAEGQNRMTITKV
jgi:hypothetical protein